MLNFGGDPQKSFTKIIEQNLLHENLNRLSQEQLKNLGANEVESLVQKISPRYKIGQGELDQYNDMFTLLKELKYSKSKAEARYFIQSGRVHFNNKKVLLEDMNGITLSQFLMSHTLQNKYIIARIGK